MVVVGAGVAIPVAVVEAVVGPDNPTPWVTAPAADRARRRAVAGTAGVVVVVALVVVVAMVGVAVAVAVAATVPARPRRPRASLIQCAPVST